MVTEHSSEDAAYARDHLFFFFFSFFFCFYDMCGYYMKVFSKYYQWRINLWLHSQGSKFTAYASQDQCNMLGQYIMRRSHDACRLFHILLFKFVTKLWGMLMRSTAKRGYKIVIKMGSQTTCWISSIIGV